MDDLISRQAAIDVVSKACHELRGVFGECKDALKALPPAQPDWDEMIVICDCCGHIIHVQRQYAERKERDGNG